MGDGGTPAAQAVREPPESGEAAAPPPRKRRRSEADAGVAEEAAEGVPAEKGELRFREGQRVLCNVSKKARGFLWRLGTVAALQHEVQGDTVPYIVELEGGGLAASPEDEDECIRLAARATLDIRIMRVFAVPEAERGAVCLRFMEGDRVAVQLDLGVWEEGFVLEAWAAPACGKRPLKGWAGQAVPYAVRLDLGDDVMVPFDTDEVIRAEAAPRPPQKSIAELLGGTVRAPAAGTTASHRFARRQKAPGEWVRVDTATGAERPCPPPDSDEEA